MRVRDVGYFYVCFGYESVCVIVINLFFVFIIFIFDENLYKIS